MENNMNITDPAELTDEQLDRIAGGSWIDRIDEPHYDRCPKCGAKGGFYSAFSDFEREVECETCGFTYLQYNGPLPQKI